MDVGGQGWRGEGDWKKKREEKGSSVGRSSSGGFGDLEGGSYLREALEATCAVDASNGED